jgi:hypothetical protein
MRAAAAALALAAAAVVAPAAGAATVASGRVTAGPALAGERVAWGEIDAGAARFVVGAPGVAPAVVHAIPAPAARRTSRGFLGYPTAFAASAEAIAGLAVTGTQERHGDVITVATATAAVGGPLTGPLELLSELYFDALALRPDGGVAFTYGGRRDRRGIRLGWLAPGAGHVRVLDRHADGPGLALVGDRVVHGHVGSVRPFRTKLVLRRLDGDGPGRALARFGARVNRVGAVDFDDERATWAARPDRRGAATRIALVTGL